jgi:hypothetical protein
MGDNGPFLPQMFLGGALNHTTSGNSAAQTQ